MLWEAGSAVFPPRRGRDGHAGDAYGDPTEPGWKLIWLLAMTTWSVAEGGRVYAEINDVIALNDTYVPSWGGGSDDMLNRLMVGGLSAEPPSSPRSTPMSGAGTGRSGSIPKASAPP